MSRPKNTSLSSVMVMLLFSLPVAAQETSDNVTSVSVDVSLDSVNVDADDQQYTVNLDDCVDLVSDSDAGVIFAWEMASAPSDGAQYSIKIREGSESCNTDSMVQESTDDCLTVAQQVDFTADSIRVEIDEQSLFEFLVSTSDCDAPEGQVDVILIFTGYADADAEDDDDHDEVRFLFSTTRPAAPAGISAEAGEATIGVSWSAVDDAGSYTVFYSTELLLQGADPNSVVATSESTTGTTVDLTDNIELDAAYYVGVVVTNSVGNTSSLSEVIVTQTQPVTDFYEFYRLRGGPETGGACSVGSPATGGLWLFATVLGLVGCFRPRRSDLLLRRSRWIALTTLVALLVAASAAWADDLVQTPISGQLEIKFGSYLPEVDQAFVDQPGPYETTFGTGGSLYFESEFDWYIWREVGTLSIAFSAGYSSNTAFAFTSDGGRSAVDETSFKIVPMRLSLVYRADFLPRRFDIPFVLYLKGGGDAYAWWSTSASGIATYRDGDVTDTGRGLVYGWHAAAGVQFLLDVLAPSMSRAFDASTGVNNTYLFAEYLMADVDDFGSAESIRLGDDVVLVGLGFEM